MSDDCELELEYGVDSQEVIEVIDGLVDTDFAAHEEVCGEDDDNIVIQEEVVINNDNNSSIGNEYEEEDIEFEEENEANDGDDEEVNEISDGNDVLSADDQNSALMAEESINADNDSNNELVIDQNNPEDNNEELTGDEKVGENEVYQWSAFTGLRVKTFTAEELALFRKPFEVGWKREVVLRGTVTSSGKKIGDVYYFSPDKKTKLRSYVEMGLYLKRSGSTLLPENFTFARQPIYRPPAEIVRHAMQRGGGQHQVQPSQIIDSSPFTPAKPVDPTLETPALVSRSARTSTASESEEQFSMSIAEGRAKRKRVAPTRFEDENYEESPFKKKAPKGPLGPNGSQSTPASTGKPIPTPLQKQQLSLQEKRRQLQHQLYQQVHEKTLKQQELESQKQSTSGQSIIATNGETVDQNVDQNSSQNTDNSVNNKETEINITKIDANGKQIILPLNARKSINSSVNTKPVKTENEEIKTINTDMSDKSDQEVAANGGEQASGAPCSMHCPGRRGMLPNLMCSRCFCLYHLDCVPGGVFLEEPRVFVCPNCLTPEDTQKSKEPKVNGQTNGIDSDMDSVPQLMPKAAQSLFVSTTPLLIQQPLVKSRSTFAPILPKPPQLQQSGLYHQQQQIYQKNRHKFQSTPVQPLATFNKSAAMNVRLPAGTHLYRVATGPNGHSMIIKDKSIKPKIKSSARKTIGAQSSSSHNGYSQLPYYKPAPIAPIAPIKLTPQQIQRQLREILHPMKAGAKKRGYSPYMEKRKTAVQSLVSPYLCLNQVLSHLTVTDLVRLRQVSRVWNQLSSQPFLWRNVKLKGIQINDWQYLAKNIIESYSSVGVDFDGVKSSSDVCEFWRNFSQIVDYLKSVRHLRFGTIPTFVLEEIANAAVTENPYNSFSILEELTVKNCFEEESDIKECRLSFLADFHALLSLKSLQLNCKNGFIADDNTIELLTHVFKQMPSLTSLVLTSLKDFTSEQFMFLTSLTKLKHLEIGSCINWFQTSDNSKSDQMESSLTDGLSGAFKYLSQLTELTDLRLVDITIDDCSQSLPQTLESLITLESLTIDNLKIEASGMDVLDHLCVVLKSLAINTFSVSTDDSNTNKCVFDLLKKLDNCSKLFWKVGALVEDSGECFVPFKRDDESTADDADIEPDVGSDGQHISDQLTDESIKYMDLTFLNEVIQSELSNAIIEIIPQ